MTAGNLGESNEICKNRIITINRMVSFFIQLWWASVWYGKVSRSGCHGQSAAQSSKKSIVLLPESYYFVRLVEKFSPKRNVTMSNQLNKMCVHYFGPVAVLWFCRSMPWQHALEGTIVIPTIEWCVGGCWVLLFTWRRFVKEGVGRRKWSDPVGKQCTLCCCCSRFRNKSHGKAMKV